MRQQQIDALENKIYESLIANPENGLGEMGACREEAQRIVREWVKENDITIVEEVLTMMQDFMDKHPNNVPKDDTFEQCVYCGHYNFGHFHWCDRPSKIN